MEKIELLKSLGFSDYFIEALQLDQVDNTIVADNAVNTVLEWKTSVDANNLIINKSSQPVSVVLNVYKYKTLQKEEGLTYKKFTDLAVIYFQNG